MTIPAPPRSLAPRTRWSLLLGHPLGLLGLVTLALGSMVVWLLIAGYGIGFQAVRSGWGPVQKVEARVSRLGEVQLWTGEKTRVAVASFGEGGTAVGYLPGELQLDQSVTALVTPSGAAWIEGLPRFPMALATLGRIAAFFLAPGLFLSVWGWLLALGQTRLLGQGEIETVRARRRLPLPRPLKGSSMVQWGQGDRSFWALVHDEEQEKSALMVGSKGVIVEAILPEYDSDSETLQGVSRGTRARAILSVLLLVGQVAVLGLFLLT